MPALIFLGAEHGASRQEALDLKWDDIDFNYGGKGIITLILSKTRMCPSRNVIFSSSSRRAEILTAGIWLIFRGLKFPPNNEIGENSHLWMDTRIERAEFPMPHTRQALFDWKRHLDLICGWTLVRERKRICPECEEIVFCRLNGVPIKRFDSAWNTNCQIAGFDDLNYHDLRHSFCSNLILSGSDLKEVKEMIGHKDLASTERYSHLTKLHKRHTQEKLAAHYARNRKV